MSTAVATLPRAALHRNASAQVRELALHPIHYLAVAGSVPTIPAVRHFVREIPGVPITNGFQRGELGQFVLRELTNRLEEPVSHLPGGMTRGHERLAYQRVQPIQHVELTPRPSVVDTKDTRDGIDAETAREHRRMAQHVAFPVVQQLVRPTDRLPQAALTFRPGQHSESVGQETLLQVGRRQRDHAGRGQLDRERESVETATNLGHDLGRLGIGDIERRVDGACALDEELDRG